MRIGRKMVKPCLDKNGKLQVKPGDEVENENVRFFAGFINPQSKMVFVDETKPRVLKNEYYCLGKVFLTGNFGTVAHNLFHVEKQ